MRKAIKITRQFSDNDKNYFPGEVYRAPEEYARKYVSRGNAEWIDEKEKITNSYKENVSIIIPVKDALKYFKKCIQSLVKYTTGYELIIIDNGSNTETKRWLSSLDQVEFTLIENKKNMGVSYAWNQGIKIAKYDYLCFLNSDTVLTPDWLKRLISGFSLKNAGIIGPSTSYCGNQQCLKEYENKRYEMSEEEIEEASYKLKKGHRKIDNLIGFCFVVKKEVIDKIGVFDHRRYEIGNTEERDFNWRVGQAGFNLYWIKDSYVHHYGHETFKDNGIDRKKTIRKNREEFYKRKEETDIFIKNDVRMGKISMSNKYIVKDILGSKMCLLKNDIGISKKLMENPIREIGATRIMEKILKKDMTIIDIGANLGYYALLEAKIGCRVYAIEPVAENVEALKRSIALNEYENIRVYQFAIGAKNGTGDMIISEYSNCHNMLLDSLNIHCPKGKTKVEIRSLDSFIKQEGIEKIDFIRMDTEGYEVEIVKGMKKAVKLMSEGAILSIEIHSKAYPEPEKPVFEMLESLKEYGFIPKMHVLRDDVIYLSDYEHLKEILGRKYCPQVFFEKGIS